MDMIKENSDCVLDYNVTNEMVICYDVPTNLNKLLTISFLILNKTTQCNMRQRLSLIIRSF